MRAAFVLLLLSVLLALAALVPAARADAGPAPDPNKVSRGRKLLAMQGCTACHSLDGSISAGPTFLGRFGGTSEVLKDHRIERVKFDAAYLRDSVRDPQEVVTKGFPAGVMPRFSLSEEQLDAMAAALQAIGQGAPVKVQPAKEPESIQYLALFVLLFVGGHLTLSGEHVRAFLTRKLGEPVFLGLYSVVAASGLAGMIWTYSSAPYVELWTSLRITRFVPLLIMPIALLFLICGVTTKTPTQVGQAFALAQENAAIGILRVTRHPQLWSYALWSFSHLPPNGDAASVLFFGALGALAILGMLHIEHRRAQSHGADWERFVAQTSLIPFEAIIEGRNRFVFSEIGLWRVALALLAYGALLFGHGFLLGASPLP